MLTALTCLALNVYFEARNQPIDGQLMVAEVTLNRVESDKYPNTVCEVVWQPHQFSWTSDGKSDTPKNMEAFAQAVLIAAQALKGDHLNTEALYFHTKDITPSWSKMFTKIGIVGDHIFYVDNR